MCLRRLSFDGQPPQDQREYSFQSCKNHAANSTILLPVGVNAKSAAAAAVVAQLRCSVDA